MIKAIPMEDWLRGCIYHDGRHGEVILPTDKVLEIANYIQLTRTSLTDGMIELPPHDRKTEPSSSEIPNNCEVKNYCDDCLYTDTCDSKEFFYACTSKATISKMEQVEDEPMTDCGDFANRLAYERGVKHAWEVAQKVFNSTVTFYEAEDVAKQIAKEVNDEHR